MPTAQKFASRVKGNGFPSCITKVDMTQPTSSSTWAAPIINALTLDQVMSLYWNLYGIIGTSTAVGTSGTPSISDLNIPNDKTPKDRVCDAYYGDYSEETTGAPDFPYATQSVVVTPAIIAMYDGVTTDEDNFLGYAMGDSELPSIVAFSQASNTGGATELNLFAGYVPATADEDAWFQLSSIYLGDPPTITNVTYQGIPLITAGIDFGTITGLTATITDLDLYTY